MYRGKLKNIGQEGDGEWVYGDHCKITGKHYIILESADCECIGEDVWEIQGMVEVTPKSVGQAIGRKDDDDADYPIGDKVAEYIAELETQLSKAKALIRHADDKHAELQAELAKLQWVSVEDRLPEDTAHVCIVNKKLQTTHGWQTNGKWRFVMCWDDQGFFFSGDASNITHWKPITLPNRCENPEGE